MAHGCPSALLPASKSWPRNWDTLIAAYAVDQANPEMLRESFDSLVVKLAGFEQEPRALYEIPEARHFIRRIPESSAKDSQAVGYLK